MGVRVLPCLLLAVAAPGQSHSQEKDRRVEEPVGRFTGASALAVEGAKAFPSEEIVRALALRPRFLSVSHPRAPLGAYLRGLEDDLRQGYLRGGFPDVQVRATAHGDRGTVRISIEEGRRLAAGPVIVEGQSVLRAESIIGAVTQPEGDDSKDAVWLPGQAARLDPRTLRKAIAAVEERYAKEGYLSPKITAAVRETPAGPASLAIQVLHEGKVSTLREVRFEGKFTDDPEAIRNAAEIRPGMRLDSAALEAIEARLDALGRYLKVKARALPSGEEGPCDLQLEVFQASFAPPFGTAPPEHRAILRRGFDWLLDPARWKGSFVLHMDLSETMERWGLQRWISEPALEVALSARGVMLSGRYLWAGSDPVTFGFMADGDEGILIAGPLRLFSRLDMSEGPRLLGNLHVVTAEPETLEPGDSEMRLRMGVGFEGGKKPGEGPIQLDLKVSETAVSFLAQWKSLEYKLDEKLLHVAFAEADGAFNRIADVDRATGEVRFAPRTISGDYLKVELPFDEAGLSKRLEAAKEEARQGRYQAVSPVRFLVRSASGIVRMLHQARMETMGTRSRAAVVVLEELLRNEADLLEALEVFSRTSTRHRVEKENRFHIPWRDGEDVDATRLGWSQMIAWIALEGTPLLPPGSWPETLLRETSCILLGETAQTEVELRRIYSSLEVGPVGYWAYSEALRFGGMLDLSRMFAREAIRQCNAEGLRKEITLLEREGFLPGKLLLLLGQAAQRIDDADAAFVREAAQKETGEAEKGLVTSLDGARLEKDARKAGARLLEAFWSAGLSDALRARCEELTR